MGHHSSCGPRWFRLQRICLQNAEDWHDPGREDPREEANPLHYSR